jgi:hypothetical protein
MEPAPEQPPPAPGDGLDASLSEVLQRSWRYVRVLLAGLALAVLALTGAVVYLLGAVADSTAQNGQQITSNQHASDQRWCGAIDLLTATPVPKPADAAANPSREATYQLYLDFVTLQREFGCQK